MALLQAQELDIAAGDRVNPRMDHVSVNARNLRQSVDFYVELLGAEPIPTPNSTSTTSTACRTTCAAALRGIWEINPQDDENMRGRLFVPE
jgi:hypothetical protein